MITNNSSNGQDKLFAECWKEAERQIAFERKITNRHILHKGHLCKIQFRDDDKLLYRNCKYCGQLIALKKFEEYVIENADAVLPWFRRNVVIKSWHAP